MAEHIYQRELTSQASQLQQIRTRFRSTKDLHTYLSDNCKYLLHSHDTSLKILSTCFE